MDFPNSVLDGRWNFDFKLDKKTAHVSYWVTSNIFNRGDRTLAFGRQRARNVVLGSIPLSQTVFSKGIL